MHCVSSNLFSHLNTFYICLYTLNWHETAGEISNENEKNSNYMHIIINILYRTGKTVSLIVRTEDQDDSVEEGELPGTQNVFQLHPITTKFYVGGVPRRAGVSYISGCLASV